VAAAHLRASDGQLGSGEIFVVRDDFHKSSSFPSLTFVDLPQHPREIAKPPKESRLKSKWAPPCSPGWRPFPLLSDCCLHIWP
jgi:hypothetical protein